ncbi:MAG: FtsW/RodA/SpoVE family cell cycle protein, partial [Candidatus Desulfofervidus auxilii]|nr:FtsW/RodA/SpoVE family cell cycle protein [Candidatus Desulfofervidus auxilii]
GTVIFLGGLTLCMLFLGGVKIKHLFLTTCPILLALIYLLTRASYRVDRLLGFLHPESDPLGVGYIILHSKLAFASGGILGQGLGGSQQKLFYLPEPYTDYIFSIIGEELGFCGVSLVVFLFLLLFWRGIKIARAARDLFGFYLALGISLWFFMQASIHMGVCLGLLPPKGITLPFISYGGTALWANLIGIGILENIYMQGRR